MQFRLHLTNLLPFKYVVEEVVLSKSPQKLSEGQYWFGRYNNLKFHNKICIKMFNLSFYLSFISFHVKRGSTQTYIWYLVSLS